MLRYRPVLTPSLLRSLMSVFLVRAYVGTALILPAVATAAAAQPAPVVSSYPTENRGGLVASNPRIDILTQAIEQHPGNAALYNSRGWYSFLDGDYTQTVSDYNQVIALGIETIDPVYHTSVYYVRGLAYGELGDTELAIESLQIAEEMYRAQGDTASAQEVAAAIDKLGK